MIFMALLVLGVYSFLNLSLELAPKEEYPELNINTSWYGVPPEVIQTEITAPIEEKVSTVKGIRKIYSESQNGSSTGAVEIQKGTNISAYLHVGDIDFYKIKMSEAALFFTDVITSSLSTPHLSNQMTVTAEILNYGTVATVDRGSILLNSVDVGQSTLIQIGDNLKFKRTYQNNNTRYDRKITITTVCFIS